MPALKMCLLNPGPVTLSQRVRRALLCPDMCHREQEFAELQTDVRRRLAQVYDQARDDYEAVLLTGSGTAAVEAMVGSLVPSHGKALVMANGIYGERMATMLEIQRKPMDVVRSAWNEPMDLNAAELRLKSGQRYSHVIAVHHETTTGQLNDIPALAELCRRHEVPLLLDAVSSFGGELIDFEKWNVEACASTANKCLHGVPGISFVLARRSVLQNGASAAPCLYLDLFRNYAEQRGGFPMFTPAVQVLHALQEAIQELTEQGGWRERHRSYSGHADAVRSGLRSLGVQPYLPDSRRQSVVLTAFQLPAGIRFEVLHHNLKRSGFVIYPGQQGLQGGIFRIAVMGELSSDDIIRFLEHFAGVLEASGIEVAEHRS